MYRADYHLHSSHSMDCKMSMDTLCQAAIAAGLNEICLTDHTDLGHPDSTTDIPPTIPEWLAEIELMREKYPELVIRAGLEIGDNPQCRDRIKEWHFSIPLDFRLLSLHLVDNEDPYFANFYDDKTQEHIYRRYVESKLESISNWTPDSYDSVAHLGYCAKFAPYPLEIRPLRYHHAPDAFDALFEILAENDKALEINTSGHKTMGECIPDRELLTRFHELGGQFVTIGSDAHLPEYVGSWNDLARALAKECGFRYMLTFDQRKPIPVLL